MKNNNTRYKYTTTPANLLYHKAKHHIKKKQKKNYTRMPPSTYTFLNTRPVVTLHNHENTKSNITN